MAYFPPTGSIVAFQSDPTKLLTHSSVSGIVNVGGSVVGFQGTSPWVVVPNNSSLFSIQPAGSVLNVNISGSVATVGTAAANQSVSGTVDIGVSPGSVAAHIKSGSVIAVLGGNTSVVATQGTTPWIIGSIYGNISGSVVASGTVTANIGTIPGSVVTFQGGTQISSLVNTVPSSVQVGASVMGHAPVVIVGGSILTSSTANQSVSGSVGIEGTPTFLQLAGSILATSATVTPAANQSVSGRVETTQIGTVITSLVSTVPSSVIVGASIFGLPPVNVTNTNLNVGGSVVAFQSNPSVLQALVGLMSTNASVITAGGTTGNSSVQVLNFPATQNVSGSVASYPLGTIVTSLVSTVPSSVIVGASIFGLPPVNVTNTNLNVGGSVVAFQGTTPWTISSIYGNVSGSVVAFQGSAPWANTNVGSVITYNIGSVITVEKSSSILAVPVGSTIAVLQAPSIVGSYAEDAGHTTADKGLFTLGVRNDAVSSITSAERDYSPIAVDDAGRNIIVPFAGQQACIISYNGSIVSGSVQLIKASVIGSRSYITDFWLTNTGSTATLVTLQGGDTSILGQFIVPAGGGSNSPGIALPLRTTLSQDLAFKVAPSQSILYAVVKGYQAP